MSDAHHRDGDDDHGHHGSPFVQHHYDDAQHQFDSGKLGVWFFLVQEVLFFSALFVAYILYRYHRPEIFAYAHHYLDVKWGAINTVVLIVSSLTAAWAVRAAQLRQQKLLIFLLSATILCACGFLGIKYIEYSHKVHEGILFGKKFDPCVSSGGAHLITRKDACPGTKRSACRADDIDQVPELPGYQKVACEVDEVTVRIEGAGADRKEIELGRRSVPPCAMTVHELPPRATNPPCWELQKNPWVCRTDEVAALVHYGDHQVRGKATKIELRCDPAPPVQAAAFPDELPAQGSLGEPLLQERPRQTTHEREVASSMGPPPEHTNMFFSIYFAMTGLHGLHVLVGVFIFIWLLIRAIKGHFTPDYFGPIDYAALYWHLVDLIWIFLFPLLYLIH
jgi:cytochrome c oxidase subunit III